MPTAHTSRSPLVRALDLNLGESQTLTLSDGAHATVKLLSLNESRDPLRNAVRSAIATIEINGQRFELESGNYNLPITCAGVQIDCPITHGYLANAMANPWALEKHARFRIWPANSPLLAPGTFGYPVSQKWFAGPMQTGNEPVYVDGPERPTAQKIYYHDGLDFGGAERDIHILSATDGIVIIAGDQVLQGQDEINAGGGYDRVVIRDDQGWYADYDHVLDIDPAIKPGARVSIGQNLGLLGKEGGSGGWSHLHFAFKTLQPSGKFGTEPAYCYAWEAWQRQHQPELIAVARPHRFGLTGDSVRLDARNSWSKTNSITRYDWTFTEGPAATGQSVERTYHRPGVYSEILKVTDAAGRISYDIAVVNILNKDNPKQLPPAIHASFAPTMNLKPNDPITFQARTFSTTYGEETWNFGDGSPTITTKSDGNAVKHAKDGYARTTHRFAHPGHYLVTVQRSNDRGETATARLHVEIQ